MVARHAEIFKCRISSIKIKQLKNFTADSFCKLVCSYLCWWPLRCSAYNRKEHSTLLGPGGERGSFLRLRSKTLVGLREVDRKYRFGCVLKSLDSGIRGRAEARAIKGQTTERQRTSVDRSTPDCEREGGHLVR